MRCEKILLIVALFGTTAVYAKEQSNYPLEVQLGWLNLKPMSNNHTYAYDVAGTQPYYQDWHAQTVDPSYNSAFELGVRYTMRQSNFNAALDWLHLNSLDSAYKQGNQTLDPAHIEFVAPPFEMSPPVFGIRRADAELNYNYDDALVNLEKMVNSTEQWMSAKIVGGINLLCIKQDLSTTFSDLVGALPTPYTYPLPADPSFSFNIRSISKFIGLGPDLGVSGQLEIWKGLSLVGAALGSLNVGITSVQENFTATSARLTQLGIGVSQQQVTVPNKTQIVPGFDGKLGLLYEFKTKRLSNVSLEGGYRLIAYMNAISTIAPQTLVQPGDNPTVPEFATGTMAIVSMTQQDRPFNLNGPYVTLKVNVT